MLLSELLRGVCDTQFTDIDVTHITSNIRDIRNDTCFVFLKGVFRDKSHLIHEIVRRAPRLIIAEEPIGSEIPLITVKDARLALSFMLFRFYLKDCKLPRLVGITGTNGKSSVMRILSHVLKTKYKVGIIGTQCIEIDETSLVDDAYTMTTPDPELLYPTLRKMADSSCDVIVMEASSHALALQKLSPLTFDIAIFTGLGEDHLDFHKTPEAYMQAKEKIFSISRLAILNIDCPAGQEYKKRIQIPFVGVSKDSADIMLRDIKASELRSTSFVYQTKQGMHPVQTPLLGEHNVYNCAYAIAAAAYLGVNEEDSIKALSSLPLIRGRMERVDTSPTIILDYAHTPSSMESILSYIASVKKKEQQMIVVFGAGGEREREKRPLMAQVAEKYASFVVVSTDNPRSESQLRIFKDIKKGFQERNHRFITDRTKAIAYAYALCGPDDILVLLGKGHEPYILKNNVKHPYSELYAIYLAKQGGQ